MDTVRRLPGACSAINLGNIMIIILDYDNTLPTALPINNIQIPSKSVQALSFRMHARIFSMHITIFEQW